MSCPYTLNLKIVGGLVNRSKQRDNLNKDISVDISFHNGYGQTKKKIDGRLNEKWNEVFSFGVEAQAITDNKGFSLTMCSKDVDQTIISFNYYSFPIGKVVEDDFYMIPFEDRKTHCGEIHLIVHLAPAGAEPFVPCERDNKYIENLESTNASLLTDNNDLKEKIEEYENDIKSKESEIEKIKKEMSSARQSDALASMRTKELEDTNKSLRKTIDNLEKQIKTKDEQIKANDKLIKDAEKNDEKIIQLKQDLKDAKKSIERKEEDLKNQINTKDYEIQKLKNEKDELIEDAKDKDKDIAQLKQDLKTKKSEIQKLENEKDELIKDAQDKDQDIAQLNKELEEANTKIQNSKKQREEIKNLMGERSLFYDFLKRFVKDANEQFLTDNS